MHRLIPKVAVGVSLLFSVTGCWERFPGNYHVLWTTDSKMLAVCGSELQLFTSDLSMVRVTQTDESCNHMTSVKNDMLVYGANGNIFYWDLTNSLLIHYVATSFSHTNYVEPSPDGTKLAAANDQGNLDVFEFPSLNLVTALPMKIVTSPSRSYPTIAWSSNNESIAFNDTETLPANKVNVTIHVYNIMNKTSILSPFKLLFLGSGSLILSWSPNNRYIAVGTISYSFDDKGKAVLHIWDIDKNTFQSGLIFPYSESITDLAWSPDSTKIAIAAGSELDVVDVATLQNTVLRYKTYFMNSVSWSPDGTKIASADGDGTIYVWDANTLQEIAQR